jgi:hypothetical protein
LGNFECPAPLLPSFLVSFVQRAMSCCSYFELLFLRLFGTVEQCSICSRRVTVDNRYVPDLPVESPQLAKCRMCGLAQAQIAAAAAFGGDGEQLVVAIEERRYYFGRSASVPPAAPAVEENPRKLSLYAILGVERDASQSEIKKAFYGCSRLCHPDKVPGHEERFKKVLHAYEILSDARKKASYDEFGKQDFEEEKIEENEMEELIKELLNMHRC